MSQQAETRGRRVVVSEFVTLDGYMVGPDEDMSWVAAGFDPQMQEDLAEDISGTVRPLRLRARDLRASSPTTGPPPSRTTRATPSSRPRARRIARIIRALNDRPRLVFSTTLGSPAGPIPGWSPATWRTRSAG